MGRNSRGLGWLLFAIAIGLVSACTADSSKEEAATPTPGPVRIAVLSHLAYAPIYIADVEGFFEEEGVNVELVSVRDIDARIALEQGLLDAYAGLASPGLFNSVHRGSSVRIVADRGHASADCPAFAIIVKAGRLVGGEPDAADLRGLTADYRPTSHYAHILETLFGRYGVSLEEVDQIDSIGLAWLDAMKGDRLDIKPSSEPQITLALDTGVARIWKSVHEILPNYQFSILLYGQRLIEDRDLGNRLMVAYLRGVRQFEEGKTDRNVEIVSGFTGLSSELVRKACWPAIDQDGRIDTASVDSFVTWAMSRGFVDNPVSAEEYSDNSFAEYASAELARRDNQ